MKRALLALPVILSTVTCTRNNPGPQPLSGEYSVSTYVAYPDTASVPQGVTVDQSGVLYVCGIDGGIWKVSKDRTISMIAQINDQLLDIVCNGKGNLFVSARNAGAICKVTTTGVVTKLAGGFVDPVSLEIDSSGNLYLGNVTVIEKVDQNGQVTNLHKISSKNAISAIAVDRSHNIYYSTMSQLWRLDSLGNDVFIAGGQVPGGNEGSGSSAAFLGCFGLRIDGNGTLWAADSYKIRKITPNGVVTTVAGGDSPGYVDGDGDTARFHYAVGLGLDANGTMYVADVANNKIRKVVHK